MCWWCSYWICQAVWRRAEKPRWGEGCKPQGHSGRTARPVQTGLHGTHLPRCCRIPSARTYTVISHSLTALYTQTGRETGLQLWDHSDAQRDTHVPIYISRIDYRGHWGANSRCCEKRRQADVHSYCLHKASLSGLCCS